MNNINIDKKDIFLNKEFSSRKQFYDFITNILLEEGKIKDTYKNSILVRESKFPTGLDTGEIKVAIPHTDYNQSNVTQLVITTLSKPIKFKKMDNPVDEIEVSIIFLILFNKPEKQLLMLKQIMNIIQDQVFLKNLLKQNSTSEVISLFNNKEENLS
ncbi:PTS sugar transporter subunit IIA [Lactobacillus sp. ESL0791]|uniref:PTS sugar transporter subunit IIA n=1 Tax=Lactobacillus sp. ESL0791 TaxID=2983234 RepID=UPI0023F95DB7|nr:PTS sugar transporter subunit IIA [Lactobacillus sp. ESL0791]MDF7638009.1 PTS sugar transporter subunit IIA [Lactobacillus sp. ESL0791]